MQGVIFLLTLLLILTADIPVGAWVFVADNGDTGWRTYVYQVGLDGFTGKAGFLVSNVIDDSAYSELLLDNLSHGCGTENRDFEQGNYTGFDLLGDSCAEVITVVEAFNGQVYNPTRGTYFSHQCCLAPGVATGAFRNARGQRGTTGSILETCISLPPWSQFTFDWAFLAGDQSPWNDFALFYLKDDDGRIVFIDGLAQIGLPPALPAIPILLLEP